jgi:hypothetical protein
VGVFEAACYRVEAARLYVEAAAADLVAGDLLRAHDVAVAAAAVERARVALDVVLEHEAHGLRRRSG